MKLPFPIVLTFLLAGAGLLSCVTQEKYQEVVQERDTFKKDALALDSINRVLGGLEEDNLNTNSYSGLLLREIEQLTVTNKNLHTNYQKLLTQVKSYSDLSEGGGSTLAQPDQEVQQSLEAYQSALQEKDLVIQQLQQQLQQQVTLNSESKSRGGGGTFGPANSNPNESCEIIQQEGAGMMAQLRQLHFNVGQALSGYSSSESPVELSNPSTRLTIKVKADFLLVPGSAQLTQNGRSALGRLAQLVQPFNQLDLYIESYPETNLVSAWEQSALTSALIAKELSLNGVRPDILYPTGKPYPGQDPMGGSLAGSVLFIFKPKYEELHQKVYNPNNANAGINRGR